jgi:hypothetical protein
VARDAVVFVELRDDDWSRQRAIWPQAWSPGMATVEPSIDWWAEYGRVRAGGVESLDVRSPVITSAWTRTWPSSSGSTPTTAPSPPGERSSRRDGAPATVSIAVRPDHTVMEMSYALRTDELAGVAAALETISQAAWLSTGGRIVKCAPPTPDCPPPTT